MQSPMGRYSNAYFRVAAWKLLSHIVSVERQAPYVVLSRRFSGIWVDKMPCQCQVKHHSVRCPYIRLQQVVYLNMFSTFATKNNKRILPQHEALKKFFSFLLQPDIHTCSMVGELLLTVCANDLKWVRPQMGTSRTVARSTTFWRKSSDLIWRWPRLCMWQWVSQPT